MPQHIKPTNILLNPQYSFISLTSHVKIKKIHNTISAILATHKTYATYNISVTPTKFIDYFSIVNEVSK